METIPIQGLLEEIDRQLVLLQDNPDSPSSQNIGDGSVKELFRKDDEYRLVLSREKERLIG